MLIKRHVTNVSLAKIYGYRWSVQFFHFYEVGNFIDHPNNRRGDVMFHSMMKTSQPETFDDSSLSQ